MNWRIGFPTVLSTLFLTLTACGGQGGEGDESEIRQNAESFSSAFNQNDAKALAQHWAEDAVYVNPKTGSTVEGREAIEQQYEQMFQEMGNRRLTLNINSISFPSGNRAVEKGVAVITMQGQPPEETTYRAVYEKRNGKWVLTEVSEADVEEAPTHFEQLKGLEWLIGEWIDEDEDVKIETVCKWDKYQNFLTQHFTVTVQDRVQLEGKQIIAWDPVNEEIRSWIFDSDGGFGEGKWKEREGRWIVEAVHTLADGSSASATNIYSNFNSSTYTWESTGRVVDGEFLPNIDSVTVTRK